MSDYFKNTELAKRYNISEATVRNWIKYSREGRVLLELVKQKDRWYVANNISNIPIIEELIRQNRKYRNSFSLRTIHPSPRFFEVFNEDQIYDIVRSLELHHEIPHKYSYFGEGARLWDRYIKQLFIAGTSSVLTGTIELLSDNYSHIERHLAGFDKVNVIDIGVGNAIPVKDLLARLIRQDKLNRYVALDFSRDVLNIAKQNLQEEFGGGFRFEGYTLDIVHERFPKVSIEDYFRSEGKIINLVLFLGGTCTNLRAPSDAFRSISESLNAGDLFIYTGKLASKSALPEWFEHEFKRNNLEKPEIADQERVVFDLLGIQESFYDIEVGFDESLGLRYARTKLKVAIKIEFALKQGRRTLVFEKGDSILLWRAWRTTPDDLTGMLRKGGFYLLHSSQTQDHNYILTIAEVQKD